jgi:FAD/FMN-containing dehydrogenase
MERWGYEEGRFDTMRVVRFGGAISEVGETETAWVGRDAKWDIEVGGHWTDPNKTEEYTQWGRDYWKALTPYCAERIYINELMDEDQKFVATSYGKNYKRLVELKNKYDPKNLFQLNGNVKPTV